jgi:hypothetical protein
MGTNHMQLPYVPHALHIGKVRVRVPTECEYNPSQARHALCGRISVGQVLGLNKAGVALLMAGALWSVRADAVPEVWHPMIVSICASAQARGCL